MHSSRMRTVHCSSHLLIPCMPPPCMPPPLPCMPPFTMHANFHHTCPPLPHMPPSPCTPPFVMHASLHYACTPFAMHTPTRGQNDRRLTIILTKIYIVLNDLHRRLQKQWFWENPFSQILVDSRRKGQEGQYSHHYL